MNEAETCRTLVRPKLESAGWEANGERHYREQIGITAGRIGEAPPAKALDAINWLTANGPQTASAIKTAGYRNAVSVLLRFGLVQAADGVGYALTDRARADGAREALWKAADTNEVVGRVVRYLEARPNASRMEIAEHMRLAMKHDWTPASKRRVGTGLRQWATWVIKGREANTVPPVPKPRPGKRTKDHDGPGLFDAE